MTSYQNIDGEALLKQLPPHKLRGRIQANVDMSKMTWFRTGGLAEVLFQPADEDDLACFLRILPLHIPLTIIGIGSNLLVRDGGIKGVVIRLSTKGFGDVILDRDNRLIAGASASDKKLAHAALEAQIGGFHFYFGIPGSIGGALCMNAGANNIETAERVIEVHALDRQGTSHIIKAANMGFSYRHCSVSNDYIFVKAVFSGYRAKQADIIAARDEVLCHRETVQPVREKTGGSTFRNPPNSSAWKVIDEAGCRGLQIGGAQMSNMHCNFMINNGEANAYDLEALGEAVREKVFHHSGIDLHWEIARIGQFTPDRIVVPFKAF